MSETCLYCLLLPTFGYENNRTKCYMHYQPDMVYIPERLCSINTCLNVADYNYPYYKYGVYCNDHKLDNMININLPCLKCNKHGSQYKNHKYTKVLCEDHKNKIVNMKPINKCDFVKCRNLAKYNYKKNMMPRYCNNHKDDYIAYCYKLSICVKCELQACYGYIETGALYCYNHKEYDMISIN